MGGISNGQEGYNKLTNDLRCQIFAWLVGFPAPFPNVHGHEHGQKVKADPHE